MIKLGFNVLCDKTFLMVYRNMTLTQGQGHKVTLKLNKNASTFLIDYSQYNDNIWVISVYGRTYIII